MIFLLFGCIQPSLSDLYSIRSYMTGAYFDSQSEIFLTILLFKNAAALYSTSGGLAFAG